MRTKETANFQTALPVTSVNKRTRSADIGTLASVFKKYVAKPNTLRYECIVYIVTYNVRTLNTINQVPVFMAFIAENNIDIICMQEHRYYHSELNLKFHDTSNEWTVVSTSTRKHSINVVIGAAGILFSLPNHKIA